jgi:hypothetical protein
MRDVTEHATSPGNEHDTEHPPDSDRRRDGPTDPTQDVVNPTPPQRGLPGTKPFGAVRGDPTPPGGDDVNPPPPQRGFDDPQAGGAKAPGRHGND